MRCLTILISLTLVIILPYTAHADFPPHMWSYSYGDTNLQTVKGVDTDANGNIIIAGDFWGKVNFGGGNLTSSLWEDQFDIFLAKFDSDGNHLWSKKFGDYDYQYGTGVAFDSAGNVILIGHMHYKADFGGGELTTSGGLDIYVAKFDPAGNHLWSKRFDGSLLDDENVEHLAIDGSDNIIITGWFVGEVDFGGGILTCVDDTDAFAAKFDPDGNHVWSQSFGSTDHQRGTAVTVDGAGDIIVVGVFHDEINLGGGPLLGDHSGCDIFLQNSPKMEITSGARCSATPGRMAPPMSLATRATISH